MSEMKEMIVKVVEKIFKDKVDKEKVDLIEQGKWSEDVWQVLLDNEMLGVAVSEKQGGAGGDLDDLLNLYRLVGKYAVPIPFVETTFANLLLENAGLDITAGKATYAIEEQPSLTVENGTVSGTIENVAWARYVDVLVAVAKGSSGLEIVQVSLKDAVIAPNTNLASEPRDQVTLINVPVQKQSKITNEQFDYSISLDAAARAALMAGAIEKAYLLTVQFTKEREQFGRQIHRFQLVQQHLANLAGEAVITSSAIDNMIAAILGNRLENEVGYTRIRVEEAAKTVAAIAHQVHAAIGVTHEHSLHHYTRRLWSWRDEGTGEAYWSQQMANRLMEVNEDDLWSYLTSFSRSLSVR
ncbi:acyl-CoA dehydrogenase [Bacillus sp. B15-48]|uniref:acyl-CoA dehydrogenase n=1 Tax=Bacillus sp. B15-48 TaxID=1548601 RepID=UPI00193EECF4|nr:acyl-CoA dehydrogenase [Bacillus sp. B15-48]MBM4763711.1 acyl-CoA dehydrogenase [Bacillus sp. B15-48]